MRFFKSIALSLLCLFALQANAQNYYVSGRTFYGGLIGGANFSQISGDNYKGFDKAGINVGGKVLMFLGNDVAAGIEILYTQRGSRGKEVVTAGKVQGVSIRDYGISLDYAEVPVCFYYVMKNKSHIGAGVSYARLVQQSERGKTNPDQNFDSNNHPFKKSAFDLVLDANLMLTKGLFLNPRFQYSLIKVREDSDVPPYFFGNSQFSSVFAMRVVYYFGFDK